MVGGLTGIFANLAGLLRPAPAFADSATTTSMESTIDNPAKWLENIIEAMTNNQPLALAITALVCIVESFLLCSWSFTF